MKKSILAVCFVGVVCWIGMQGCNDAPTANKGSTDTTTHQDTSKFLGTWAQVLDTSNHVGGYNQCWYIDSTFKGFDTLRFVSDTQLGNQTYYYYSSDTLYTSMLWVSERYYLDKQYYTLKGDTLMLEVLYTPACIETFRKIK